MIRSRSERVWDRGGGARDFKEVGDGGFGLVDGFGGRVEDLVLGFGGGDVEEVLVFIFGGEEFAADEGFLGAGLGGGRL